MRAAVVYESLFGNTATVAEAIAAGISAADPSAEVTCAPITEDGPVVGAVDLLVAGGPTHFLGMTSWRSRQMAPQYAERPGDRGSVAAALGEPRRGVREWLDELPPAAGATRAAAFDTRLSILFPGSAARLIARRLRDHGYQIVNMPEGFLVEAFQGPLSTGEHDRAQAWGTSLASMQPPERDPAPPATTRQKPAPRRAPGLRSASVTSGRLRALRQPRHHPAPAAVRGHQ